MTAVVRVVALILAVVVVPLASNAQPPPKVPRIGFLASGSPSVSPHFLEAFRQGLRDLGWVEGRNIAIEYRWAEGRLERRPDLPKAKQRALGARHTREVYLDPQTNLLYTTDGNGGGPPLYRPDAHGAADPRRARRAEVAR
jgi:hypothetical protein